MTTVYERIERTLMRRGAMMRQTGTIRPTDHLIAFALLATPGVLAAAITILVVWLI